jgi:hypothetical protein
MSEIAVGPVSMSPEDQPSPVEMTEQQYKEAKYFEWLDGCEVARLNIQNTYGSCGLEKHYTPELPAWENPKLSDADRQKVWAGAQVIDMNKKRQTFSRAAILLASSHDHARFFDDVKCDYLGDSKKLGKFREISSHHNHTPFSDIDFNYDQGVLNAFTGNTIIHVRETLDPEAKTQSQKLFIIAINLMAMEVQRLYADDKPRIESLGSPDLSFNEIIPLTTKSLQGMEAYLQVDDKNELKPYVLELFQNQAARLQPQLMKSAQQGWTYKAASDEEFSKLRPIEQLDKERGVLWALGPSLGYGVTDRGAIIQPFSRPEIGQ